MLDMGTSVTPYVENRKLFKIVSNRLLRMLESGETAKKISRDNFGKAANLLRKAGIKELVNEGGATEGLYAMFSGAMESGKEQDQYLERILSDAFYLETLITSGEIPAGEGEHYGVMQKMFEALSDKAETLSGNYQHGERTLGYVFEPNRHLKVVSNEIHLAQLKGVAEVPSFSSFKKLRDILKGYSARVKGDLNSDSGKDTSSVVYPISGGAGVEIGIIRRVYSGGQQ